VNDKLQTAICCTIALMTAYVFYCGGTVLSGLPMPDGALFGGVAAAIGLIFGYNIRGVMASPPAPAAPEPVDKDVEAAERATRPRKGKDSEE